MNQYDWVHTDLLLPNALFSTMSLRGQSPKQSPDSEGIASAEERGLAMTWEEGDGILDIFDRYNFTVKEDEPLEKEVAIDPELLGKAYEKFNAIRPDNYEEFLRALKSGKKGEESKFNKQYGVYYTPREIVHYMCQQSLIHYLDAELNDRAGFDTDEKSARPTQPAGLPTKEDIETLILKGEQIREHDARVLAEGRETETYSFKMPESIRRHAARIDAALANIKVCDPAVGSGAFPVGMMNEIVRARGVLGMYLERPDRSLKDSDGKILSPRPVRSTYAFKRACIENSLYGVDIDPGAVEIAKLRLWLSLIVDEDDIHSIQPLPNLDYKIVCGNSLLGVEKDIFNHNLFAELEDLKPRYFNATQPAQKQALKQQIDSLIDQLTNGRKQFDFEIYFSEVFHQKGGFDVVIGNPPYGANLLEEEKKYLKTRHENISERIRNTFLYFIGEAFRRLKQNGIVCFIFPNEFLFQIYMTRARKFFLENSQFLFAINLGESVFEAIVPTCIVGIAKTHQDTYSIPVADLRNASLEELPALLAVENFPRTTNKKILAAPNCIFAFDGLKSDLINRLGSNFEPFGNFCEDIANGISTSCDEIYIVSKQFAEENGFEEEYLKECIRGGQFNRFYCPEHTNEYVLYVTNKFDAKTGKNIYEYLRKNKKLLIEKSIEKKQGKRDWHVLFRPRYENLFNKPKLLFRQTGDRIIAAIDKTVGYYCIDSVNIGQVKLEYHGQIKYFIGLLNSKLMVFFYQEISQEKGRVLAQVKPQRIRSLPIAKANTQQQKAIEKLVDRILAAKAKDPQADTSALEREIDRLVYGLYGLTEEEIKIVEGE
jgi:hypothetical protein